MEIRSHKPHPDHPTTPRPQQPRQTGWRGINWSRHAAFDYLSPTKAGQIASVGQRSGPSPRCRVPAGPRAAARRGIPNQRGSCAPSVAAARAEGAAAHDQAEEARMQRERSESEARRAARPCVVVGLHERPDGRRSARQGAHDRGRVHARVPGDAGDAEDRRIGKWVHVDDRRVAAGPDLVVVGEHTEADRVVEHIEHSAAGPLAAADTLARSLRQAALGRPSLNAHQSDPLLDDAAAQARLERLPARARSAIGRRPASLPGRLTTVPSRRTIDRHYFGIASTNMTQPALLINSNRCPAGPANVRSSAVRSGLAGALQNPGSTL